MFVVHGTRKFLDRVGRPAGGPIDDSTTALGAWYATVLFWKPQVALFVNEPTLLPALMLLAPAATIIDRLPKAVASVLRAQGVGDEFIEGELTSMTSYRLAKTRNRSVIGIMNEFSYLGKIHRSETDAVDLLDLALRLAETPCGPLCGSHTSPDRELAALVARHRK